MDRSLKSHNRVIRRDISCDHRTPTIRLIVSEKLQDGAERITARVKHYVIVIPVQDICTGHIAQPRMEHVILKLMFLRNLLHLGKISAITHNQELLPLHLGILMRPRIGFLHHIRHVRHAPRLFPCCRPVAEA